MRLSGHGAPDSPEMCRNAPQGCGGVGGPGLDAQQVPRKPPSPCVNDGPQRTQQRRSTRGFRKPSTSRPHLVIRRTFSCVLSGPALRPCRVCGACAWDVCVGRVCGAWMWGVGDTGQGPALLGLSLFRPADRRGSSGADAAPDPRSQRWTPTVGRRRVGLPGTGRGGALAPAGCPAKGLLAGDAFVPLCLSRKIRTWSHALGVKHILLSSQVRIWTLMHRKYSLEVVTLCSLPSTSCPAARSPSRPRALPSPAWMGRLTNPGPAGASCPEPGPDLTETCSRGTPAGLTLRPTPHPVPVTSQRPQGPTHQLLSQVSPHCPRA